MRLNPLAAYGLVRELRSIAAEESHLTVTGAAGPAGELRAELGRGGRPGAVRDGDLREAAALVHVLDAAPAAADERLFDEARRRSIPVVVVLTGEAMDVRVRSAEHVRARSGVGASVPELARVLAEKLGEEATGLAARVPVLRRPVCDDLISGFSRKNGLVGVALFVPGADLPVLTLNQLRLVLRIGAAHGVEIDRDRLPEILAVIGSGFALRAAARQVLGAVPVAGWAVKGALAYVGTKALGEAAVRYFAARAEPAHEQPELGVGVFDPET